ncbi:hypothetical protein PG993_006040 [Apiospora rasikravindrae]|uniref:Uncharacterized protein n=1 Tax=Apiospora rasikravindrae TaxID=990691 RepID=A0ABR1TCB2_9PEZI
MSSSSRAEGDGSATRVPSRIKALPTTAAERQAGRVRLSESRQETYRSEPSSSSNRTVKLADQTRHESVAIKKAQKKMQKKLDRILGPLNQG